MRSLVRGGAVAILAAATVLAAAAPARAAVGGSGDDSLDGGSGLADWCDTGDNGGTRTGCELPFGWAWP